MDVKVNFVSSLSEFVMLCFCSIPLFPFEQGSNQHRMALMRLTYLKASLNLCCYLAALHDKHFCLFTITFYLYLNRSFENPFSHFLTPSASDCLPNGLLFAQWNVC